MFKFRSWGGVVGFAGDASSPSMGRLSSASCLEIPLQSQLRVPRKASHTIQLSVFSTTFRTPHHSFQMTASVVLLPHEKVHIFVMKHLSYS